MTFSEKLNFSDNETIDEDLELINLKNAILRNKKQIFYFTFAGFFLAFLFGLQKETWKGEFQIVLNQPKDSRLSGLGAVIGGGSSEIIGNLLSKTGTVASSLKTEVGVLKSPSLLIDIFEFVKKEEYKDNSKKEMNYKDWRKRLKFKLLKDTTILDISYVSQEKDTVIPVLNRISKKYQEYTGKKELKTVNSALNYFDNQIKIYNEKSNQSVKEAQEFALKYDFGISPVFIPNTFEALKNFPNPEAIKVKSLNELRLVNNYLDKVKKNEYDADEILYFAQNSLNSPDIPEVLSNSNNLKVQLAQKRSVYKENDILIKKLKILENSSNNEVKKSLLGALKAKKLELESTLEASNRPEGVVNKFLELVNQAKQEIKTVEQLKIQSRILSLEKEKSKEPWELITRPTLLPNPIAPKRKRIIAAGIFLGFLSGCGFARLKEGRKNLILNSNHIIQLSGWNLLCELKMNNWDSSLETLKCLALGKISNSKKNISIIKIGNFENQILDKFLEVLNTYLPDKEIKVFNDITDANKFGEVIPIAYISSSSVAELENIKQNLSLQDSKVLGTILIS